MAYLSLWRQKQTFEEQAQRRHRDSSAARVKPVGAVRSKRESHDVLTDVAIYRVSSRSNFTGYALPASVAKAKEAQKALALMLHMSMKNAMPAR